MLVLLISECAGKAWHRTRRIADAYLERIGERTWRGRLTQEGLRRLREDLAKAASRHMSVACHRIASRQRFELEWIVGSTAPFNDAGQVATYRGHNYDAYLEARPEPPSRWPWLARIVRTAGLLHDVGKANAAFQGKLRSGRAEADPVRHEILSMLAVGHWRQKGGTLADALGDLVGAAFAIPERIELGTQADEAALVEWLIATHHRLLDSMCFPDHWLGGSLLLTHHLNRSRPWQAEPASVTLDPGLLDAELHASLAPLGACCNTVTSRLLWEAAAAYGRLALVMADQLISKQQDVDQLRHPNGEVAPGTLLANTANGLPKQALVEHLIKVSVEGALCVSDLHDVVRLAPSLDVHGLPRPFRQRSAGRFAWQDEVRDAVAARAPGGFFGVLMAETGSGKTQAAAKVVAALRSDVRYTVGLPLRTLTTQTGTEYRERLSLSDADLAVVIGGMPAEESRTPEGDQPPTGSTVWSDEGQPEVDGGAERWADLPEALKRHLGSSPKALRLVGSPILVTTIDHLMPAADQRRTGFVIPALRLLSADLVIDEIDAFEERDLVALGRLVHLAGVFGRHVLLASATLPPAVARAFWRSWRAGWSCHAALHGIPDRASGGVFSNLTAPQLVEGGLDALDPLLQAAAETIIARLDVRPCPRRAAIMPREAARDLPTLFAAITSKVVEQHGWHARSVTVARKTRTLSLQLVRFAHVDACVAYAKHIERQPAEDVDVRYVVYHARHPLLVRAEIEGFLDRVLRRSDGDRALLADPVLRRSLLAADRGLAVVVIATSVEEVGRDHDFDAGVIEPSSSRSIIQLAGRVQRHRLRIPTEPNLALMPTTVRHILRPAEPFAYRQPGVEGPDLVGRDRFGKPLAGFIRGEPFRLESPWLDELLNPAAWEGVTAAPRLHEASHEPLVELEHERLAAFLEGPAFHALMPVWNGTMAWLSAAHPEVMRFRAGEPRITAWLEPLTRRFLQIEDGRVAEHGVQLEVAWPELSSSRALLDLDPEHLLASRSDDMSGPALKGLAARLMRVDLPVWQAAWRYHPQMGVFRELVDDRQLGSNL